ncbi:unnamed protein product, partial [Ectocarpus sp. 8 AP-2014]
LCIVPFRCLVCWARRRRGLRRIYSFGLPAPPARDYLAPVIESCILLAYRCRRRAIIRSRAYRRRRGPPSNRWHPHRRGETLFAAARIPAANRSGGSGSSTTAIMLCPGRGILNVRALAIPPSPNCRVIAFVCLPLHAPFRLLPALLASTSRHRRRRRRRRRLTP